jgi:phenylpropionate dioxygenase-like ring-hydroxylating dioxygenase large terminal subunit
MVPVADPTVVGLLARRRPGHCLPGAMYGDPVVHAADLAHVWHREWVFAGHECELAEPGAFVTLTVGAYPLIVVRGLDGQLRALHNVCRHRGAIVCDAPAGTTRRRFVCPYHQWTYELDGTLHRARAMTERVAADDVDPGQLGLGAAHCASVGGLVFVCVADEPPPFEPFRSLVAAHLAPFDLSRARVAHSATIVEAGNWKLVMENNRECYHCRLSHPELSRTFPEAPLHSGGGSDDEVRATEQMVADCEAAGLPSSFLAAADHQYRVMRMALNEGATSMTMDGTPAVARRFAELPGAQAVPDLGDLLLYHYPSTWDHFVGDHAVTFRMLATGPTTTELRTTWLVPGEAVEGVDYDVAELTKVWLATNDQDSALVARAQRGVASPAFRPGPYSPVEEEGVIQFVDWYAGRLAAGLAGLPR